MKHALIDLDEIKLVKKSIRDAGGRKPGNMLTVKTFEEMAEFYIENLSSRPALIELLLKAFFAGHNDGRKNNMPVPSAIDFAEFLSQNNLTDEKDK